MAVHHNSQAATVTEATPAVSMVSTAAEAAAQAKVREQSNSEGTEVNGREWWQSN